MRTKIKECQVLLLYQVVTAVKIKTKYTHFRGTAQVSKLAEASTV